MTFYFLSFAFKRTKMAKEKRNLDQLRQTAEDFYIRLCMTGKEIAELLDISEQTVSKWKKGRDGEKSWDDRKAEMQLTPTKVKEILLKEALLLAEGKDSKVDADKLSKIVSAIERLDRKINVRIIMDVFREFDNYVAEVEPKIAVEFTKYHKMFLQHRIALES